MSENVGKPAERGKKRWSLGRLFKRKSRKCENSSSSSSSSDGDGKKRGLLGGLRKKKEEGSKDVTGSFVIQQGRWRDGESSSEEGSTRWRRTRAARNERYMKRLSRGTSLCEEETGVTRSDLEIHRPRGLPRANPGSQQQQCLSDSQLKGGSGYERAEKAASFPRRKEEERAPAAPAPPPAPPPPPPPVRKSSRDRRSSNLEEALHELEEIYRSLRMEELWEVKVRRGADSDSGYSCDTVRSRATDDMAYRRLNKKESRCCDAREMVARGGSYLLVSPTLSPPPLVKLTPLHLPDEPDVTLDDVVYRSVNRSNNTLRILDPQPPFGIPLGPVSPAPESDYLHLTPVPIAKPSRVPDVAMDDLAFRNLRKEPKRKAARSLSANLSALVPRRETNNNRPDKGLNQSEGLRLARRMLDNRRKALYKKEEERRALQILEDEARATSRQIEEQLQVLDNEETDSIARLLTDLTRSLDQVEQRWTEQGATNSNLINLCMHPLIPSLLAIVVIIASYILFLAS